MGMNKNSWGPCYNNEDGSSNPYDKNVNPKVYKVEDGHPWKESQWPSLRDAGRCDLCTAPEHLHMQANERCGETIPGYPTPENPTKIRRCNKLKNHPGRHGWIGGPSLNPDW